MFNVFFHTVDGNFPPLTVRTLHRLIVFVLEDMGGKLNDGEWESLGKVLAGCLRSCLVENELELKVEGAPDQGGPPEGSLVSVVCAQQIGILLAKVDLVPIKLYSEVREGM